MIDDIKRILVVVDPAAHDHPSLARAVRLAERHGCALELYVCDVESDIPDCWAGGIRANEYRGLLRERRLEELEALARPLRERGLTVVTRSEWHKPLEDAILRHLNETHPDLAVYSDLLIVKPAWRGELPKEGPQ